MPQTFLAGDTIELRPIEKEDLNENYQSWFNDPEVCQFNSHHRFPNYRQDMEEYYNNVIKSHGNLVLAITDIASKRHIGNIALQEIDPINNTAELAIIIGNKNYWGKGIGREASALLVEHGFKALNLNRIYFGTAEDNIGMQKIGAAVGFVKEGVARSALYKNGSYKNIITYGLLRGEYEKKAEENSGRLS